MTAPLPCLPGWISWKEIVSLVRQITKGIKTCCLPLTLTCVLSEQRRVTGLAGHTRSALVRATWPPAVL